MSQGTLLGDQTSYIILGIIFLQFFTIFVNLRLPSGTNHGLQFSQLTYKGAITSRVFLIILSVVIVLSLFINLGLLFVCFDNNNLVYYRLCIVMKIAVVLNSILVILYILSDVFHEERDLKKIQELKENT